MLISPHSAAVYIVLLAVLNRESPLSAAFSHGVAVQCLVGSHSWRTALLLCAPYCLTIDNYGKCMDTPVPAVLLA
jgi:hypothetical protein